MFQTIRNAWALPDLRKKLLYTLMIIVIFRIGSAITVPFLDAKLLSNAMSSNGNNLFGYIDILTGGAFSKATIFAMSVSPYINASIIIQLLAVAIPALGRLEREGETGRKVIAQITRYVTVGLGLLQGFFYYIFLRNQGIVLSDYRNGAVGVWAAFVIIAAFSAGAALIMWLGEQINEKGIGNGISIILFAGIVSRGPAIFLSIQKYWSLAVGGSTQYFYLVPAVLVLFLVVIAAIVLMNEAERRIPVQYAKRVVGRKMYGGQNTFIPIKVTMSGVMPIIFASSIVAIPGTISSFFVTSTSKGWWVTVLQWFNATGWIYALVYFLLIIAFNYFYVNIQYNPYEMANNLKKNNGGIPGIRPGKPTSDYIKHILYRITLIGALFLAVIAVLPIFLSLGAGMSFALGGTTVLIVVGVALDTMRSLESQMMMRHYKGFLE
ncbi:MAG: preprotein translocase subunit SecY [Clostridia bacterium]|nr:preprotein translocase subunit SecY [Clostridia bacterium]MDR3644608.1 preprotein translocase subunit SecY [Clostridia bacterium]